ncbi:4Fe-4S ferredoxin, iron-sulfur binding domain protein [Magnetococcus marinus MC-1]|uniref:4Fe-4S ferredoxin, iron-sulfur binding domain protein n=1 Tax=Magnetococcus marinus (strain ATCC BAA-1437 / JCM 17883 / MC-1) TaxID=156889 RepID=A0L9G5_MAGMM|nr:4Fe-4S binding protein [Magnetococcus marinus]ABK44608.1 4Fe-4S ferredoxin, iron-sulfur binding domain protein [Magnetococcus marinus MC-1]
MVGLRNIRRLYAGFFFGLFVLLLWISDFKHMQGYATDLLLSLDPLTALATVLTSGTLYGGLALALLIVVGTLFYGRFFCSWICPLGILNQFMGWLFSFRRGVQACHDNRYRPIFQLKYFILLVLLVATLFGLLQIGWLDPLALMVRSFTTAVLPAWHHVSGAGPYIKTPLFQGALLIGGLFIGILLANRFLPRFWCRVLCPLGALLGLLALRAPYRIHRDLDRCTGCNKCQWHCQGACDPQGQLRVSECHLCMNCIESCPEGALHFGLPQQRSSAHQSLDINRRRVMETALASVMLMPMIQRSASARTLSSAGLIRPPGALDEVDFLARCIKCEACMRVCPTNVLQPALLEGGFEGIWTPLLNNQIGYCEHHCVLCGQVCPTAAIRPISVAEKVGAKPFEQPIKLGTAFFDHGRCLPWAMQTPCIVCEEVCPTSPKAIWYKKVEIPQRNGTMIALKQPYVEPDQCIGCGICENQCPVDDQRAIRVTSVGESRSQTNKMLLKKGG